MKILLSTYASPGALDLKTRLSPLIKVKTVEQILVVMDYPGPAMDKVKYYYPKGIFGRINVLKVFIKFILMVRLSLTMNVDLIWGIYLYMHGIVAFFTAKITRKPIVLSLIAGETEVKVYKDKFGKSILRYFYLMNIGNIIEQLIIKLLKKSTLILVTGKRTKQYLTRLGIKPENIGVQPNVIFTEKFIPITKQKKYDIVTHGRITETKNLEMFLDIIYELKKIYPKIKVGVAGDGPRKDSIEMKVIELNLDENIEFIGYVSDVTSFLNTGRIYLLTSRHEGFPKSLLEAMSCGLGCVVPNVGDISDLAINDVNAVVIDQYDDIDSYVRGLQKLFVHKDYYQFIVNNSIESAQKRSIAYASQIWQHNLETIFCQ